MPKTPVIFSEQINFLAMDGTKLDLISIALFRSEGMKFAGPARDFVAKGIREFIEGLSPADRKRFEEIKDNMKITLGR